MTYASVTDMPAETAMVFRYCLHAEAGRPKQGKMSRAMEDRIMRRNAEELAKLYGVGE